MNSLQAFLKYYLPDADLHALCDRFNRERIEKGSLLVRPGDQSQTLAFIVEGCFRVYYYEYSGKEITTWFSFENMMVADLYSFYTGDPASYYVEALENSVIHTISKHMLDQLYEEHPEYSRFGKLFAEEALTMVMKRMQDLQTKSAETRYKELLEMTGLTDRVPLKYIASYLGITDTSLSRIRKNIR